MLPGLPGGQLVANPVPGPAEIPRRELAPLIEEAQRAAEAAGVTGKAVTPFLLARLAEMTGGRTIAANVALVLNNARLAAAIAAAIAALRR